MEPHSKAGDESGTQDKAADAADFARVLGEELDLLSTLRDGVSCDRALSPYQRARNSNLAGLAFSGGGIRSATFNLGAIQALSRYGLLSKFDYLSTVSGGGYIGGWLSALLHRKMARGEVVNQKAVDYFQSCLKSHPDDALSCDADKNVGFEPVEHLAVRYLRRYSNYLSPRLGLSGDMLAVVTIFLRNFTLIQLTLISLVASILIFVHVLAAGSGVFGLEATWLSDGLRNLGHSFGGSMASGLAFAGDFLSSRWPFAGASLLIFFAFWSAGRLLTTRAGHEEKAGREKHARINRRVHLSVILPTMLSAWCFSAAAVLRHGDMQFGEHNLLVEALYWAVCGAIGYGAAWYLGYWGARTKRQSYEGGAAESAGGEGASSEAEDEEEHVELVIFLSAILSGVIFGLLLFAAACQIKRASSAAPIDIWHAVAFGPPLFILALAFAVTVHVGMARRSLTEPEREWLARLGGGVMFATAVWVLLFALVLYATPFVHWLAGGGIAALAVWAGGSGVGAWLARGPATGVNHGGIQWKEIITRIAPWLFVVGLAVIVAHFTHIALLEALTADGYIEPPGTDFGIAAASVLHQLNELPVGGSFAAFVLLATLFLLISWRLDINLFSLHALYCNRLARTYLGASRGKRQPNPYSGFDAEDDLPFSDLARQRPIPIINTAINMTGGDDLAWQTRRAASFAFTPAWSGYETRDSQGEKLGTYRPTRRYARNRKLGTLMAISGAAASPNMGYHTSAAVAALMTAFNLRLGRWCGNPERDTWDQISPDFALEPIFAELTGSATAQADWINLTDGGHFDNLGVYELIRRRCRLIVVTDAGCDPRHVFEDLANTVRKCWTDLGVNIRFDEFEQMHLKQDSRCSGAHGTVGRIQYYDEGPDGAIIYLKSSMIGDEWPDIRQYAEAHKDFPHETTADQFFDENQFEAYRHLGYKVVAKMADTFQALGQDPESISIEQIASRLIPMQK